MQSLKWLERWQMRAKEDLGSDRIILTHTQLVGTGKEVTGSQNEGLVGGLEKQRRCIRDSSTLSHYGLFPSPDNQLYWLLFQKCRPLPTSAKHPLPSYTVKTASQLMEACCQIQTRGLYPTLLFHTTVLAQQNFPFLSSLLQPPPKSVPKG